MSYAEDVTHQNLQIKEISAEQHHDFISQQAAVSFMQNPYWARTKQAWKNQSIGWWDGETLVAASLVLFRPIPVPGLSKRSLAYLSDGPVFDPGNVTFEDLLTPLAPYLRSHGAFLIRMGLPFVAQSWEADSVRKALSSGEYKMLTDLEPGYTSTTVRELVQTLKAKGWQAPEQSEDFVAGQAQYQARIPLPQLNEEHRKNRDSPEFEQAVEDVLMRMDSSSRRQTRKSTRSELTITHAGLEDIPRWQELNEETAQRDDFTPRPEEYFTEMFSALNDSPTAQCKLLFAEYEGELLAAAIYVQQGDTGWYVYGASSRAESKRYAPRALQLEQIKLSLEAGAAWYDLGGVSPTLNKEHPLAGLTRFKTTMGADVMETVGEWDLPINKVLANAFNLYMKSRG